MPESTTRAEIETVIKRLLVEDLQADPGQIASAGADTPLLGRGIGLDSVEALRLGLGLENAFDIRIPDSDLTAELFASVGTLTEYVMIKTQVSAQPR
jgi:acyl carrier protein